MYATETMCGLKSLKNLFGLLQKLPKLKLNYHTETESYIALGPLVLLIVERKLILGLFLLGFVNLITLYISHQSLYSLTTDNKPQQH